MKKVLIVLTLFFIVSAGINGETSYAAATIPYTLLIDGKKVGFSNSNQPLIVNGTTLVPFRPIFEELGLNVIWKSKTNQVIGESSQLNISITMGSTKAVVNDLAMNMPAAPTTINGTTYIPLRFIAESSGGELQLYGDEGNNTAWFLSEKQVDLASAVFDQDLSAVDKLLNNGADPTIGVGPLGPAIFSFVPFLSDNVELISLFLKYGMDVNAKELFTEDTILHSAVYHGRVNTVKYLLEQGAYPTLNSFVGTPLEIAKNSGYT